MSGSCGSLSIQLLHINLAGEIDVVCGVVQQLCVCVEPVGFRNERGGELLKVRHPVELFG